MTKSLDIKNIDVNKLVKNPWNTNIVTPENEEKIKASLKKFGIFRPIIAREIEGQDKLQIVGGEHRWMVAKKLGYTEIPVVNLGQIDEVTAKEIGLVDNAQYGHDDTLMLAELLKTLGEDEQEIMNIMPYTDEELNNIFSSTSIMLDEIGFDEEDEPNISLTDVANNKQVQTHQIMRFKVPMEDSEYITKLIETTMRTQGFNQDDSLSNAGNALVHLLRNLK